MTVQSATSSFLHIRYMQSILHEPGAQDHHTIQNNRSHTNITKVIFGFTPQSRKHPAEDSQTRAVIAKVKETQ